MRLSSYRRLLRDLQDARDGQPTEDKAARTIAFHASIFAGMIGFLAGASLVGLTDPGGLLPWVCTASGLVSGFGMAYLVLRVYHFFGFHPVAILADTLKGAVKVLFLGGFLFGATCATFLALPFILPGDFPQVYVYALYPLLLIPIAAVAFALFRP